MTDVRIEIRQPQPYAAIRLEVMQGEIGLKAPPLIGEVFGWIATHGGRPAGAPFFNYMEFLPGGAMVMEAGVPTAALMAAEGRVVTGTLPGGRYAYLMHEGPYDGLYAANMELGRWAHANGHRLAERREGDRIVGATRLEIYLTEHDATPPVTEVAFRLVDE